MSDKYWSDLHKDYQTRDWIDRPSLFAETTLPYLPPDGKLLDLGAGLGQDSRYFAEHGFEVISTDLVQPDVVDSTATFKQVDLREELPFDGASFDVVYAHLSLHYFDHETTVRLFDQVMRVLKPGGIFAFFTNSMSDPEYGSGKVIEKDFFEFEENTKRYFSVETARKFAENFEVQLIDNHGETYKDAAKGVHNLIRFIGNKPKQVIFPTALPFCGAIIERDNKGIKEVFMQTRWQPGGDPVYSGTLEFPAGKLDIPFENVYDALAREIKEETNLTLKSIKNNSQTKPLTSNRDDSIMGFRPFCCVQQLGNAKPWIGFIFVCEVERSESSSQLSEAKDGHWMTVSEIKKIHQEHPEQLFGLELPAWEYYFNES